MKKKTAFICAVMLIVALASTFVACNKVEIDGNLAKGEYPQELGSLINSADRAIIERALEQGATADERATAVMTLWTIANNSRMNTENSLMLQESDAGIAAGTVIMHGFNLRSNGKWFYQLATQVETGNAALDAIMSMFAGYLKVGYATGDGKFYYYGKIGPQFKCDCTIQTFPYATYIIPVDENASDDDKPFAHALTEQDLKTELHYLNSMHEINNMKFSKEIIADDAKISYNAAEHFYTVEFSVDMSADAQLLQEWFALPKEDMAVGGQTLERYNSYTAVLEVWENGYAKSFESHADREAGMGSGKPVDRFEYLWTEDEILDVLKQDERLTVADKMVMTSLEDYINYYSDPTFSKKELLGIEIFGIVVGCVLFVVIVIAVVIEVLVKCGKLPKLAKRRADRKAKKLRKKELRRAKKNGTHLNEESAETDTEEIFFEIANQETVDTDIEETAETVKDSVDGEN